MPEKQHSIGKPLPGFSTSFWKELRLAHSRMDIYLPVALAYVLFVINIREPVFVTSVVLLIGLLAASIAPAVFAARSLGSRKARLDLRARTADLSDKDRRKACRKWCRQHLLRSMMPVQLALLALAPLCGIVTAYALDEEPLSILVGLTFWAQASSACLLSAMMGARCAVDAGRPRTAAAVWSAGIVVLLRIWPMAVFWTAFRAAFLADEVYIIWPVAALDTAFCALASFLLWFGLPTPLITQLEEQEADYRTDNEALVDAPEWAGLDVSFWSLLRWRFWRDPYCQAVQKGSWSGGRMLLMYAAVTLSAAASPFLAYFGAQRYGLDIGALVAIAVLMRLPCWIAPAKIVMGVSDERKQGLLEDMLLTPIAPLRLVASKLLARLLPLIRASLVLALIVLMFLAYACVTRDGGDAWMYFFAGVYVLVLWTPTVIGHGAIGLYLSVRLKSSVAALTLSYLIVLLAEIGMCGTAIAAMHDWGAYRWARAAEVPNAITGALAIVIGLCLLTRVMLAATAHRLALHRSE